MLALLGFLFCLQRKNLRLKIFPHRFLLLLRLLFELFDLVRVSLFKCLNLFFVIALA